MLALCTYNRASGLSSALDSLSRLDVPDGIEFEMILVDNDSEGSGREIYDRFAQGISFKSNYYCEETKGITFARNRALKLASDLGASHLAFFDDDARVTKDWLRQLHKWSQSNPSAIISGPQLSCFQAKPPDWAKSLSYFNPTRHESGKRRRWAATNNIVIPLFIYTKLGLCFDTVLNDSGGSDQCFSMEAHNHGIDIIWCNEAIVYESVPSTRLRVPWLLLRNFRYGSTGHYMHRKIHAPTFATIISLSKGCGYSALGLLKIMASVYAGRPSFIEGLCLISRGVGWPLGVFNKRSKEYASR